MAITKLWSRRSESGGHSAGNILKQTIDYACNPDKTKNVSYTMIDSDFIEDEDTINNVLKYVVNEKKTKITKGEYAQLEEVLVSGLNCTVQTADKEFLQVKEFWNKTDKNLLWHGVQSFEPGEITPETAHEVGIKLAQRMWGNDYQILVTTHCDKHHIHNHFVFNSVSFTNGKKYNYSNSEIYRLRYESDRLCKEYGLSVIEHPKSKGDSYYEYINGSNKKTVRALIKEDIDSAIQNSHSLREVYLFLENELGYEINMRGKYITLKPPGRERAFRLDNLDKNKRNPNAVNNYTEEAIVKRLQRKNDGLPYSPNKPKYVSYKKYHTRVKNNCSDYSDFVETVFKGSSARSTYWHYYYLLHNINKSKTKYPTVHFEMRREAQQKINRYSKHISFFSRTGIKNLSELKQYQMLMKNKIDVLETQRNDLRNKLRNCINDNDQNILLNQIEDINTAITQLRSEYSICSEIISNIPHIEEQLEKIENQNNNNQERIDEKWQQKKL